MEGEAATLEEAAEPRGWARADRGAAVSQADGQKHRRVEGDADVCCTSGSPDAPARTAARDAASDNERQPRLRGRATYLLRGGWGLRAAEHRPW